MDLNVKIDARQSTDLAFLTECWLPEKTDKVQINAVGLVLRDWPYDNHQHVNLILECIDKIIPQGWKVHCYSLNPDSDKHFTALAKKKFEVMEWDPGKMEIHEFLNHMALNRLLVSSRAHGAILGACLGIPGICIDLEPKLRTVAKMLKRSFRLMPADVLQLQNGISRIAENPPSTHKDVVENQENLFSMIDEIKTDLASWIKS